jgi:hypothetical protein
VVRELGVKLRRESPELGETRPGDVREVVVFVVVADVPGDAVQSTVIRVGVLPRAERVMFGDVVSGNRV